jgi:hypothetical protein
MGVPRLNKETTLQALRCLGRWMRLQDFRFRMAVKTTKSTVCDRRNGAQKKKGKSVSCLISLREVEPWQPPPAYQVNWAKVLHLCHYALLQVASHSRMRSSIVAHQSRMLQYVITWVLETESGFVADTTVKESKRETYQHFSPE